jgi:hypothetical protein
MYKSKFDWLTTIYGTYTTQLSQTEISHNSMILKTGIMSIGVSNFLIYDAEDWPADGLFGAI